MVYIMSSYDNIVVAFVPFLKHFFKHNIFFSTPSCILRIDKPPLSANPRLGLYSPRKLMFEE